MAIGIKTSGLDRQVNLNKNKTKLRLTDKINQTIYIKTSNVNDRKVLTRDVKKVYSHSSGIIKGTCQISPDKKANVSFDVKLGSWIYED